MGEPGELVQLYVYDITYGRRSNYSSGVFGFSFIYHTSIVVFGKEYTFNCKKGISVKSVNREALPDRAYVLGRTRKTKDELEKFRKDLSSTSFHKKNYDVLYRNCQIFCIELCKFLGVEGLPEDIMAILQFARKNFSSTGLGYIASLSKNNSS